MASVHIANFVDMTFMLYADDIAATITATLEMARRALLPELAVFANNPWTEA